jgi:hypothetical protein
MTVMERIQLLEGPKILRRELENDDRELGEILFPTIEEEVKSEFQKDNEGNGLQIP